MLAKGPAREVREQSSLLLVWRISRAPWLGTCDVGASLLAKGLVREVREQSSLLQVWRVSRAPWLGRSIVM